MSMDAGGRYLIINVIIKWRYVTFYLKCSIINEFAYARQLKQCIIDKVNACISKTVVILWVLLTYVEILIMT